MIGDSQGVIFCASREKAQISLGLILVITGADHRIPEIDQLIAIPRLIPCLKDEDTEAHKGQAPFPHTGGWSSRLEENKH